MKVKLLIARAGKGFSNVPGDVVDLDEQEAKTLVARGQAEAIAVAPKRKPKAKPE